MDLRGCAGEVTAVREMIRCLLNLAFKEVREEDGKTILSFKISNGVKTGANDQLILSLSEDSYLQTKQKDLRTVRAFEININGKPTVATCRKCQTPYSGLAPNYCVQCGLKIKGEKK